MLQGNLPGVVSLEEVWKDYLSAISDLSDKARASLLKQRAKHEEALKEIAAKLEGSTPPPDGAREFLDEAAQRLGDFAQHADLLAMLRRRFPPPSKAGPITACPASGGESEGAASDSATGGEGAPIVQPSLEEVLSVLDADGMTAGEVLKALENAGIRTNSTCLAKMLWLGVDRKQISTEGERRGKRYMLAK